VVQKWRAGVCLLAAVWLGSLWPNRSPMQAAQSGPAAATTAVATQRAVFTQYCVSCHNEKLKQAGTVPIALEGEALWDVAGNAAIWEKVVLKMRAGVMPPAGSPRPDGSARAAFLGWLEGELDRAAAARPNPGRTEPFHRLNRAEYRNAVRDLLALDLDVSSMLPADDASYGFDNIAGVLKMSPTLMEQYLAAAQRVSRLAVGTPVPAPSIEYFRITDDLSQDVHLPGLPFGTRGGTQVNYVFPADAEYEIRVRIARDLNESVPVYADDQHVEINIDGARVGGFTLPGVSTPPPGTGRGAGPAPAGRGGQPAVGRGGQPAAGRGGQPAAGPPAGRAGGDGQQPERPQISQIDGGIRVTARQREERNKADESWNVRVPIKAGPRALTVTFTNSTSALDETTRLPFQRPYPAGVNIPETRKGVHLRSVEIAGPYNVTGPGDTPSRQRIFLCRPTARTSNGSNVPNGSNASNDQCAKRVLTALARRAYRRPVTDADVAPLMAFYREGATSGFEEGIQHAVRRLLVSPEFLLRVERDPPSRSALRRDESSLHVYRIDDVELASRLSFFLWSSIPDEELLVAAERGRLRDPAVISAQVRRMLADRRADAFVTNFAGQWLFLRNLQAVVPVQNIFPDFDDTLRQAFRRETELFFDSIVRENRSMLDLLRADYTFLNERLARHYGIPNVKGSHFRRVALGPESARSGILGQGSILTVTSYPDRTSPVVRGKWILENLLGTPPPPPIPNAGDLKPTRGDGVVLSMRERMEQHRRNPVCASCHAMMDPLGLSLENFDAVGKWRTLGESSASIDASGVFPDGSKFQGAAGLKQLLLRSDRFVPTVTEKLLTYALGRGLEHYDAPAVRTIVRNAARDDYRFSTVITGIVQSAPFTMRRAGE
jgi:mono/diheme cytochrome c family protein